MSRPAGTSSSRLAFAGVLLLVYAAPLLWPPSPVPPGTVTGGGAWLLERIVPGVPVLWVAVRLVALAVATLLLSGAPIPVVPHPFRAVLDVVGQAGGMRRAIAIVVALAHAVAARWADRLGPVGQVGYLLALFVPAAVLALPARAKAPAWAWRQAVPAAAHHRGMDGAPTRR